MGGSMSTQHEIVSKERGFRVHRVEPGSPGDVCGLSSVLDYIVVANGVRLDHDDGTFVRMIQEHKGGGGEPKEDVGAQNCHCRVY